MCHLCRQGTESQEYPLHFRKALLETHNPLCNCSFFYGQYQAAFGPAFSGGSGAVLAWAEVELPFHDTPQTCYSGDCWYLELGDPPLFIAEVWNGDGTRMFWRLEKSSWLLGEWSFLFSLSSLWKRPWGFSFCHLRAQLYFLCPKLKDLVHGSVILAWANKILSKRGTEGTPLSHCGCAQNLQTVESSLPSSCAADYFWSVKNQSKHFGNARVVQERVSSNCLLLHLCLALKIPKYGKWLVRIQAVAQWFEKGAGGQRRVSLS